MNFIVCKVLTLCRSNITNHWFCVSIIMLWYLVTSLFEHPIILVIVVVAALIHQVFEYFSHIVVIWSLLELQIPAVL